MNQTVVQAHKKITTRASDIANEEIKSYRSVLKELGYEENLVRRIAQFMGIGGYYRPKPFRDGNSNFGLVIDFNFEGISDAESRKGLRQAFKEVGANAIKQAVTENSAAIRTAIVTEAREGNNYFANFKEERRLFSPDILPLVPKEPKRRNVKTIDDPEGTQGTLF